MVLSHRLLASQDVPNFLRRVYQRTSARGDCQQTRYTVIGRPWLEICVDRDGGFPAIVTLYDGDEEIERWPWTDPQGFAKACMRVKLMLEAAHV